MCVNVFPPPPDATCGNCRCAANDENFDRFSNSFWVAELGQFENRKFCSDDRIEAEFSDDFGRNCIVNLVEKWVWLKDFGMISIFGNSREKETLAKLTQTWMQNYIKVKY